MKKILLSIVALAAAVLLAGCNKQTETEDPVEGTLEVVDIADNCATVKVSQTSGKFYGAKLIECMTVDEVTVDIDNDIQMVAFIEANGTDITLPYEKKLEKVRIGRDRVTAVIFYNKDGIAEVVKHVVWTPAGRPEGWSEDNTPGRVEEIIW
ncbi:MAG: hypothetical protein ACI3ZQ_11170 [Candidatus Cryptobacteroides sp.]